MDDFLCGALNDKDLDTLRRLAAAGVQSAGEITRLEDVKWPNRLASSWECSQRLRAEQEVRGQHKISDADVVFGTRDQQNIRDSNGSVIEERLDRWNMVVINDGSSYKLHFNKNKMSGIDWTLEDAALARVRNWKVRWLDSINILVNDEEEKEYLSSGCRNSNGFKSCGGLGKYRFQFPKTKYKVLVKKEVWHISM